MTTTQPRRQWSLPTPHSSPVYILCTIIDLSCITATQEGSSGDDYMRAASALDDGGVIVAGYYNGTGWDGAISSRLSDFAAVKLDSDGEVVWRWQVMITRMRMEHDKQPKKHVSVIDAALHERKSSSIYIEGLPANVVFAIVVRVRLRHETFVCQYINMLPRFVVYKMTSYRGYVCPPPTHFRIHNVCHVLLTLMS